VPELPAGARLATGGGLSGVVGEPVGVVVESEPAVVVEPNFVAGSAVGAVQAGSGLEATGSEKPPQFSSVRRPRAGGRAGRGVSVGAGAAFAAGSCERSGSWCCNTKAVPVASPEQVGRLSFMSTSRRRPTLRHIGSPGSIRCCLWYHNWRGHGAAGRGIGGELLRSWSAQRAAEQARLAAENDRVETTSNPRYAQSLECRALFASATAAHAT
jgi:hypothetical protein